MKCLFAVLCFFLTFAAAYATTPSAPQAPAQYQLSTPINGVAAPLGTLTGNNSLPVRPPCLVGDSVTFQGSGFNNYFYAATGGTGPYTFTVAGLPTGITATTASPKVYFSMTVYTAGTYPITVTVNDSASHTGTFNYNLVATIWGDLVFTPTSGGTPGVFTLALSDVYYEMNDRGPAYWINFLSGGAIKIPKSNIFAHPGDTTANVVARMPQIIAAAKGGQCGSLVTMIGTNDLGGDTLANIENRIWNPAAPLTSIVGQELSTGLPAFLETILPRTLTAGVAQNQLFSINRWIKSLAGTIPNLHIVDAATAYGDPFDPFGAPRTYTRQIAGQFGNGVYTYAQSGLPGCASLNTSTGVLTSTCTAASTSTVTFSVSDTASHTGSNNWTVNINPTQAQPISMGAITSIVGTLGIIQYLDYSYDGLHPKTPGSENAFAPVETALVATVPAYAQPTWSVKDYYDATNNPNGNLIVANGGQMGFMAGTGTVSGRASGLAPDGWELVTVDGGCTSCGYTAVGAPSTLSDGTPSVSITLGGTASGGYATQVDLIYLTSSLPSFVAGDSLVGNCRVEVASGSLHVSSVLTQLYYTAGGVNYTLQGGSASGLNPNVSDLAPENVNFKGLGHTPWPDSPNAPLKTFPVLPGSMSGYMALTIEIPITSGTSGPVAGVFNIGACSINHG